MRRWLEFVVLSLVSVSLLNTRKVDGPPDLQKLDPQKLGFTGYPPTAYDHVFLSCPLDGACTRTDRFRVDPMPPGCCILTVRNGDGRGTDEIHSYEIFLNGKRIVSSNHSPHVDTPVKLRTSNTIRVVLSGGPQSRLSVMIFTTRASQSEQDHPVRRRACRLHSYDGAVAVDAASSSRSMLISAVITEMTTGPTKIPMNPNT